MHQKIPPCLVGFLLLLTATTSANAFKAERHREITADAARLLAVCEGRDVADNPLVGPVAALAQGAVDEDHDWMTLIRRLRNWHFFDSREYERAKAPDYKMEKPLPTSPKAWGGLVKTTLNDLYEEHIKPFDSLPEGRCYDTFAQAGRVLHYIQDMRVPAHIIPAYHSTDKYGLNNADSFDKYCPKRWTQAEHCVIPPSSLKGLCPRLLEAKPLTTTSARVMLREAAFATFRRLDAPIFDYPSCKDVKWLGTLWRTPAETQEPRYPGFGEYINGNHAFGKPGLMIDSCKEATSGITEMEYDKLFQDGWINAVLDTAAFIRALSAKTDCSVTSQKSNPAHPATPEATR